MENAECLQNYKPDRAKSLNFGGRFSSTLRGSEAIVQLEEKQAMIQEKL